MGTGVGEAALAAELAGAGAATGAGLGAAGIAEAGLLGGEVAGGLGAAGAGLGGLGGSALGAEYGGLASLSPAVQQATAGTAALNPEITAQVTQAANVGAVPPVGSSFAQPIPSEYASRMAQLSQGAGQYGPGTQLAMAPGVGSDAGLPGMTQNAQAAANWANTPSPTTTEFANADLMDPSRFGSEASAWDAATAGGGQYGGPVEAAKSSFTNPFSAFKNWYDKQDDMTKGVVKYGGMGLGALGAAKALSKNPSVAPAEKYSGPLSKFSYDPSTYTPYTYKPYVAGGPVEAMSNQNSIGANTGYPQANIQHGAYATPWQTPVSRNVVADAGDTGVDQMTGLERMAGGGIANLGSYSDGGRLLRGPGDGMSDNIPANISGKQPARLADGEFVVPADVVSGLGNGSTDAGAKQLYKMLDKVRTARTGTKKQGKQINPNKYTPA